MLLNDDHHHCHILSEYEEVLLGLGRKLEEMMIAGHGEENENEDGEAEPDASTSGITMYDTGEVKVTVTTSEISREEDEPVRREKTQPTESDGSTAKASTSQPLPVRKSKPSKQNDTF
ncbi:hypothetical protein YC2023_097215 [Brassica napus]